MKKNGPVVAVIFLFLLLPICSFVSDAVEPLKKVERTKWRVGDTLVYEVTQKDANGKLIKKFLETWTVIKSDENGYAVAIDRDGKKTVEFYNHDLNFVRAEDEKGGIIVVCEPEVPVFQWPLIPGQWRKGSYSCKDKNGREVDPP